MKKGRYKVTVSGTIIEAICNGHAAIFPACEMVYDGKWCTFYKGGY